MRHCSPKRVSEAFLSAWRYGRHPSPFVPDAKCRVLEAYPNPLVERVVSRLSPTQGSSEQSVGKLLPRKVTGRTFSRREALGLLATAPSVALLAATGCSSGLAVNRAGSDDPALLQLLEAIRSVRSRSISPVDLTRACLERIQSSRPKLNAFITLTPERALAQAIQAEREVAGGRWRGPLHGIPIAIKDNIDTAGIRTTAGSALYESRSPTEDAEIRTAPPKKASEDFLSA